jgi:phosphohistidine phosphatase SixA
VSSPFLRARETAEAIAAAAGLVAAVDEHLAPGADADDLRAAVAGRGETVVTVGHEPDCSEIVLELTGRRVQFPAAGFAEIDL